MFRIGRLLGKSLVFAACCAVASTLAFAADYRLALADLLRQELSELRASNRFLYLDLTLRKDSTVAWYRDGRPYPPRRIEREYTALQGALVVYTSVYERGGSTNEFIHAIKIKAGDIGKVVGKGVIVVLPFALTEIETPEKLEAAWGRADAYGLDDAGTGSVAYDSGGRRSGGAVFRYEHKRIAEITLQNLR